MTIRHPLRHAVACALFSIVIFDKPVMAAPVLNYNVTTSQLQAMLDGPGLTITNLSITQGKIGQYGHFTDGKVSSGAGPVLGIDSGVYMTTGDSNSLQGPNNSAKYIKAWKVIQSDVDLTGLNPKATYDPVIIEFDVIPAGDRLNFTLVFGSEEYPEYVCSKYNDTFGLFVSGPSLSGTQNAGKLPGTNNNITVNNINSGTAGLNTDGTACILTNNNAFIDNGDGTGNANTQMDGFTKPLTTLLSGLTPNQTYHVKLALADASDAGYDSSLLFKWLTSTSSTPSDLSLSIAGPSKPTYGQTVSLTYTVTNSSSVSNTLVQTLLELPSGFTYVSDNSGGKYNKTTGEWEVDTVAANGTQTLTIQAIVNTTGSYTTSGEISYAFNQDPDSTPFNRDTYPAEDDTATLAMAPVANSAPVITSNGAAATAALSKPENQTAVTTVTATDANGDNLTYSITGGADAAKFAINPTTGVLTFVTAPDFESPTDSGANNVYDVTVNVTDGTLTDTQAIAVTITDVNENVAPVISSNGGGTTAAISKPENQTAVTTVTATDANGDNLTYSISGGTDAAKFTINASTGVLTFVAAPDFEVPTDANKDNIYNVTVKVTDGTLTDTQDIAVTITDVNENVAPVISSNGGGTTAAISKPENQTAVTTVTATDANGDNLTYSISGGTDAAKFTINASTGVLTFVAAPDFEVPTDANKDNVYNVIVSVSDGTITDTQDIAVTITDVNENGAPIIGSNGGAATAALAIPENQTAVTTVTATDVNGDNLTYSISGGTDAAKFTINPTTGILTFVTAPDFEKPTDSNTDNVYSVTVKVSDGTLTDTQDIAVTITDVNENVAPVINSSGTATLSIPENQTAVMTVAATDANGDNLTYSISGGTDAGKFTINPTTGVLTFVTAPDFEKPTDTNADNVYNVTVSVTDGTLMDTQAIAVTITDVNENGAPIISSDGGGTTAALSVPENQTAVTTVTATDINGDKLTYSISGGTDAVRFAINPTTGVLTFVTAPDFESPVDSNTDNVYNVTVTVSDGILTDTQAIAVTIMNVDDTLVRLQVRALLQGSYRASTGLMNDTLRTTGVIPDNQPYTVAPFKYMGSEVLASSLFNTSGNDAPVDWMLVELRSSSQPATILAQKAVIVQRDGDLVDSQTASGTLVLNNILPGNYYVSVRHRNHLGVMSATALSLSPSPTLVDFGLTVTPVYGTNARLVGSSVALLWAGDSNMSGQVIGNGPGNDANTILSSVLMAAGNGSLNSNYRLIGYTPADLNMDGAAVFAGADNDTNLVIANVLTFPTNANMNANFIIMGTLP